MSEAKLRWGILSVAKINERLLPAFRKARNAELLAIASRSLEKAQIAAGRTNIPRAYGSYEELLAQPDIDAIYLPLPNTLHAPWALKAAEAGKHVLCEKPLTPDAAGAAELVAAFRAKKRCLMDGFMWPHHPRTQEVKDLLRRNEIGTIRRVSGSFTFLMPELSTKNIRLQSDLGGGSLLDVGCYPVYGIRWALGAEPGRVWASARYDFGCDVEMNGMMWFENGAVATFDCGFDHPLRQHLEITGTRGVLTMDHPWLPPDPAVYTIRREGDPIGQIETHTIHGQDQIQHMLENFGRYVLEGQPVSPPPEEAVKTLKVLDALAKSAKIGQAVDVV